jgi:hypothetical protein
MRWLFCATLALFCIPAFAQSLPAYDLLLRGGHVIDAANHIDAVMDVAIKDGRIARVAQGLKPSDAIKTIDVKGMVVTPGLIDMHFHAYNGTGERGSYAGDLSIHHRGCRQLRLAQFRGFQGPGNRPLQNPRTGDAEHRGRGNAGQPL